MTVQAANITRRSARAILLDDDQHVVLIKRTKPDQDPYWTTPGGGVEDRDASPEDALARELKEELGASAAIGRRVLLIPSGTEAVVAVQEIFVARLLSMDDAARSGAEWTDTSRGGYEVERVPIDQIGEIDLKPLELRDFVIRNAAALVAEVLA